MAHSNIQPTAHPAINTVLDLLLAEVQTALSHNFLGLYIGGSLATGDFDPQASDLDLLVLTKQAFVPEHLLALAAAHQRLAASGEPWATRIEASYIPQPAFRAYNPLIHAAGHFPRIEFSDPLEVVSHDRDWLLQRYIYREQGIVVAGPPLASLIDPVDPADLPQAVRAVLFDWWQAQITDSTHLQHLGYRAYAALTMCRALYTLHHHNIVSKPKAASWAQAAYPAWAAIIERALAFWRVNGAGNVVPNPIAETQALIRFTLDQAAR